ncbi:lysine transporter LysE [Marinomonas rhizomae]|uniref:Threonine/homoserine/homoserine lactone efflux protein n=1 Tax=Marinomonas rhizomae TaxID=491948 RepID=A0A366IZ49_9GAMM|nr:LysE family transporter [Marinomonas rhizomae]RBP79420.1 threonine/homoserine/homoserine lactone efflux protein [Marinomonas rhizomae]RNF71348.1 lysine transporter LysE [Marinomonas rhizomae]
MLEIIIYAFGVMYSPGPANTLALLAGVNGQGWRALRYCVGVGLAMLILFLLLGYLGGEIIPDGYQVVIAILGGLYIAYLGVKIMQASFHSQAIATDASMIHFKTGLILQLCNPKALVAIVPIVTVQYPRYEITGMGIAVWSLILSAMALGAPSVYLLAGSRLQHVAMNPKVMAWVNRLMALLLFYVAYRFIVNP